MRRKGFRIIAVFALAFISLALTGCEVDKSAPSKPSEVPPAVVVRDNPSIKLKFGITTEGAEGVTDTFDVLHDYVRLGGLEKGNNAIQLGDWIDLEDLYVAAYDGHGLIGSEKTPQTNTDLGGNKGTLLRLIVVGINSFKPGRGTVSGGSTTVNGTRNGQYRVGESSSGVPSHVVFQFKNVPVVRRMNPECTNAGGYRDSEMRTYVKENFFAGLKNAGVPERVLWAPTRMVSVESAGGSHEISDLLWLPTERELFHEGRSRRHTQPLQTAGPFSANDETASNQARLEYYSGGEEDNQLESPHVISNGKRIKYTSGGGPLTYWVASLEKDWGESFCTVLSDGTNGATGADLDSDMGRYGEGVAPAFCVK